MPDGTPRYKTADRGFAPRVRNGLHTQDGRSQKIRNRRLGAGPRTLAPRIRTGCRGPRYPPPWLRRPAGARRSDTGTAGSGPGVFPGRWPSAGTVGSPASAAIAAPPRDTRDYSTGPVGGSAETPFHIP
jgi:hypothetical protein